MKKLFDLIGTQVLSIQDGSVLGRICDIVFRNTSLLKIEGFLMESELKSKKKKFIPWYDLRFRNDICICSMRTDPIEFEEDKLEEFSGKNILRKEDLKDLEVFTQDGLEVGLLKDVLLSEEEGLIEGIQCSDGLFHDLLHGRTTYPLIGKTLITGDIMLISKESIEEAIMLK